MSPHPDLTKLTKPFPESMVSEKPGKFKAQYVAHARVVEKLLRVVGPYSYEVTQLIRSPEGVVVGCIGSLTVTVDGKVVTVSEVGDVEDPTGDTKEKNNGARAKDASSDAFKRCAMRVGVGLDMWIKGDPVLHGLLAADEDDTPSD